jgi:hypothetical protein
MLNLNPNPRSISVLLATVLFSAFLVAEAAEPAQRAAAATMTLCSGDLILHLDSQGQATAQSGAGQSTFSGLSELSGLKAVGGVEADLSKAGVAQFKRLMKREESGEACVVRDRFSAEGDALRWEVTVEGAGAPFACEVSSKVTLPTTPASVYWTTWGTAATEPEIKQRIGDRSNYWDDPLQFVKLNARSFDFGGTSHVQRDAISVPVFVVGEADTKRAVMVAHGLEETLISMVAQVEPTGIVQFRRFNRRLEKGKLFSYVLYLRSQATDWRPALGWYRSKHSRYFVPKTEATWRVAGNGAYSEYEGEVDSYQLLRSGLQFNWKASYDYVYMGMYLPYTHDLDWQWTNARFQGSEAPPFPTSLRNLASYSKRMRASGFHVLNYMNPAELGLKIESFATPPARKAARDEDLWKDANDFVFYKLRDAVLFPKDQAEPYKAWEQGVLLDVGVPSFQNHLLAQAQMHLDALPESSGVCFDRTDYLRFFNWKRDDGISWVAGAACGSLALGWVDYMNKIGPQFHAKEKVIFCNPLYRRLDLYENIDGFYDEFGQSDCHSISVCSFLALDKPFVGWTSSLPDTVPQHDFFQRYLYLGAYLTAPMPFNNHTIKPGNAEVDQLYLDYGLLFEALRFRTWYLEPFPIEVKGAKGNCFQTPGGLLIPLMLGGANQEARLTVNSQHPVLTGAHFVELLHPGDREWRTLRAQPLRLGEEISVPLKHGCALVRLVHTKVTPASKAFLKSATLNIESALPSAKIYLREKKSNGWTSFEKFKAPLSLKKTAQVQFKVCDSEGRPLPQGLFENEWVKCSPPSPTLIPDKGMIFNERTVEIRVPGWMTNATVRYTLDGSAPTETSPRYTAPLKLKRAGDVRARVYLEGEASGVASATFTAALPPPQLPDIYLSELTALQETVGVPGSAVQKDLAWNKTPLSMMGTKFEKGLGVHAVSDLVYEVKPGYKRFVAYVGVDDCMRSYKQPSVVFQVYGDVRDGTGAAEAIAGETLLFQSDVLRPEMAVGVDVAIPEGIKRLRLHVGDAGNGIECDHADWCNAGFVTK